MKRSLLAAFILFTLSSPLVMAADDVKPFIATNDVIYGRKYGMALTMNVFKPRHNANGAGIVWVVSGGWFSTDAIAHAEFRGSPINELIKRGYTVFAVMHGSQPRFTIPEILEDMHRAVRFIRHHASDYGINPDRIGITGGSAGGHLSLMQGTAGKDGDPKAADPVDRESSDVQAVACFFPPTDFLNYGKQGENALGRGVLKNFPAPFAFHELIQTKGVFGGHFETVTDEEKILEIGRSISPITHVTADDAPTLIIHGDADLLVPIQQAQLMVAKLEEVGVPAKLVVKEGAAHGWADLPSDIPTLADWFDKHLK